MPQSSHKISKDTTLPDENGRKPIGTRCHDKTFTNRSCQRNSGNIYQLLKKPLIIAVFITAAASGISAYDYGTAEHQSRKTEALAAVSFSDDGTKASLGMDHAILLAKLLIQADLLAKGYDYEGAIALLQSNPAYAGERQVLNAVSDYEAIITTLVPADHAQIPHVFFQGLIMDSSKAFDGDSRTSGYNQMMTTKSEFLKILQSMYDKGFVLVRMHDIASQVTEEDGRNRLAAGSIMLPEGKQAFVMSQDDVCYYEYMEEDGFASRMVIGEDGKPATQLRMDDGTVSVGSYDLVPILEDFIREHPDFSYQGARAVISLTGYEGILGYRTAFSYKIRETYEQDRQEAAKVAQCLRDNGWELASHGWGHRDMDSLSLEALKEDTDKWKNEVESLIGPTDIFMFPFGSDIADWQPYTEDNEKYQYLKSAGFRYFCNENSSRYWVQMGEDYFRQSRRGLDGYRMYHDMVESNPQKRTLSDLFHAEDVFDQNRPTPVPPR